MVLPRHLREVVRAELTHKRLFPDASVLLAGLLEPTSASADVLACATGATIILSAHVEDRALNALRKAAPHLIAPFNDSLLRLGAASTIQRIERQSLVESRPGAPKLSLEDQQVLADAVGGRADILLSHDALLFSAAPPPLRVRAPSSVAFSPLDPSNVQGGATESTFIGLFYPEWSSDAVKGTTEQFYFFEIVRFARAFYDAKKGEARLQITPQSGSRVTLHMPMKVHANGYHFVAAVIREKSVLLYVDDVTTARDVHLGPPPTNTTFHPFMSANADGQICGGCHFRLEPRALSVAEIRRLWLSQSTQLSDGEVQFADFARRSALILPLTKPQDGNGPG